MISFEITIYSHLSFCQKLVHIFGLGLAKQKNTIFDTERVIFTNLVAFWFPGRMIGSQKFEKILKIIFEPHKNSKIFGKIIIVEISTQKRNEP